MGGIRACEVAAGSVRGAEVSARHRSLLERLHGIVQTLTESVESDLATGSPSSGERDHALDLMVKLTGVAAKLIALEREAHFLDGDIDPKDLSDEQIIRILAGQAGEGVEP